MSEDPPPNPYQVMDKKNFIPPPRLSSLAQDYSRPYQDVAGGSQLPKHNSKSQSRRRESPAGGSNVPNFRDACPGPGKKPAPQKSKALDKRPRPRSLNCQEQVVKKDDSPEYGSVQTPGTKKQNLNHLLNFHFAPRESRGRWGVGLDSRTNAGGANHARSKFIKESFIQANCQFMVGPEKDLEAYKFDPDLLVDWKYIEQVLIRTYGETPVCPICLSPPCAAKMTRCGHIFCWPCLLHYLSYADKHSQPCPICYESVTSKDLKSVVANMCKEFHTGDLVEMQLMCRPKDSSEVEIPVACKFGGGIDWERRYKKLLPISPEQVKLEVLGREEKELSWRFREVAQRGVEELKQGYSENVVSLEAQFVSDAMRQLELRKEALMDRIQLVEHNCTKNLVLPVGCEPVFALISGTEQDVQIPPLLLESPLVENAIIVKNVLQVENNSNGPEVATPEGFTSPELEAQNHKVANHGSVDLTGYHCFYQAADGRNAFMNPVNMAMLWKSFGESPATWPQRLQLRILEIEYITMTSELRKRFKFLQHVPVSTCVQLVEVELKFPMIPEDVVRSFAPLLSQRRRRRSERARVEKRRERLQAEAERRNQPQRPQIDSKVDFPTCGVAEEEFQGLEHAILASLEMQSSAQQDSDVESESHEVDTTSHTRGIQITTPGHYKSPTLNDDGFPVLRENVAASTSTSLSFAQALTSSPPQQGLIWKRSPTYPLTSGMNSGLSLRRVASESEAEHEEGTSIPEFRNSVKDAIARAFATISINEESEPNGNAGGIGQKKKGRKKGKVLFATGMGMGNN